MIAQPEPSREPQPQNLVAVFEAQARRRGEAAAIRHKVDGAWADVSWAELARRARCLSDGLVAWGLRPGVEIQSLSGCGVVQEVSLETRSGWPMVRLATERGLW